MRGVEAEELGERLFVLVVPKVEELVLEYRVQAVSLDVEVWFRLL